jgi:membrane associated rhomboid family serine protease
MFSSIVDDIKREFSYGNMVTRLIIINIIFFIALNLIGVSLRIANGWQTPEVYYTIRNFFLISSDWLHNLTHPWAIITSMFAHEGFWHILWNMLFLYWFGRIVGDFIGDHRLLPLYLLGGLLGGLAYFISINIFAYSGGGEHYALGASAAVMAVVVASGVLAPEYNMRLLLLGNVKLKYIVAALVLLDVFALGNNLNTGGHFAHLGGALMGWIFVRRLQEGDDWSEPINNLLSRISEFFRGLGQDRGTRKRGPRVAYRNPNRGPRRQAAGGRRTDSRQQSEQGLSYQERLDAILDKIKDSGYESLNQEEKEFLFNASNKKE